jgi:hypothetical protein
MATDQPSGSTSPAPFAYYDPDSCSWRMCQGSLLEASGESCTTWPRQGTWDRGYVWELPTSGPLTDASASSSLLPTPDGAVFNDGQSTEAYLERKRRELAKGYNGNGGGTSLAMTTKLLHEGVDPEAWRGQLLPTPNASDDKGGEGPTRWARQEEGSTGGPALKDIAHLLPTPTVQDGENTAGPSQFERNTPPLNAVATQLLPTPSAADGDGGRLDNEETFRSGRRPSGTKATRTLRSTLC